MARMFVCAHRALQLRLLSALMVQGTSSDAGKSTIVAGLGRLLRRRGLRVRPSYHPTLLDELHISLRYGNLSVDEVVRFLRSRPSGLHHRTQRGVDLADLVTEMTLVKHPFRDQNVKGSGVLMARTHIGLCNYVRQDVFAVGTDGAGHFLGRREVDDCCWFGTFVAASWTACSSLVPPDFAGRVEHFLTIRESLGRRGCTFLAFSTVKFARDCHRTQRQTGVDLDCGLGNRDDSCQASVPRPECTGAKGSGVLMARMFVCAHRALQLRKAGRLCCRH